MIFKFMAWLTALAGTVLGLRFIFAGASLLRDWGLEPAEAPLVICRRLGALYLGLAVMFFAGRNAGPSELRSAVCLGMSVAITLLSCLGPFELRAGRVTNGILVPSITEAILAIGFFWAWWSGR
ncbi:MAG: hypothetical protein QM817_04750 [Archangium sp.]